MLRLLCVRNTVRRERGVNSIDARWLVTMLQMRNYISLIDAGLLVCHDMPFIEEGN